MHFFRFIAISFLFPSLMEIYRAYEASEKLDEDKKNILNNSQKNK